MVSKILKDVGWKDDHLLKNYITNEKNALKVANAVAGTYHTHIKQSEHVPKKGEMGLFATEKIKGETTLGFYYGEYCMLPLKADGTVNGSTTRDIDAVHQTSYIEELLDADIEANHSLSLVGDKTCHVTYLNHDVDKSNCRMDTKIDLKPQFMHNFSSMQPPTIKNMLSNHEICLVRTTRDIEKGEELLLNYDPSGRIQFQFDSDELGDDEDDEMGDDDTGIGEEMVVHEPVNRGDLTPNSAQPPVVSPPVGSTSSASGAKKCLAFQQVILYALFAHDMTKFIEALDVL